LTGGFSFKSGGGDNRLKSAKILKTTPCKVDFGHGEEQDYILSYILDIECGAA
jgi:hypothetical protein